MTVLYYFYIINLDAICGKEPESGLCRAMHRRWYHDASTGECKQFIYGGCDGNENQFKTKKECEDFCKNWIDCLLFNRILWLGNISMLSSLKKMCVVFLEIFYLLNVI